MLWWHAGSDATSYVRAGNLLVILLVLAARAGRCDTALCGVE